MREWTGLIRSLVVYWRPGRQRSLRRLYATWVGEGDLVFDVGAHLGDRSHAFAALGARVIALEPQPVIARWLRYLVGRNEKITVRTEAVGAVSGTERLSISSRSPTLSTLSTSWREKVVAKNSTFEGVEWEGAIDVDVVTLDGLIETYGRPDFCKIDVEGYEPQVLTGLSYPIAALSFEFVSGDSERATACMERLQVLGSYEFNVICGEGREFEFMTWTTPDDITRWLRTGAGGASSGDVYARLLSDTSPGEASSGG
jgi:FkbM family methyltransferase